MGGGTVQKWEVDVRKLFFWKLYFKLSVVFQADPGVGGGTVRRPSSPSSNSEFNECSAIHYAVFTFLIDVE